MLSEAQAQFNVLIYKWIGKSGKLGTDICYYTAPGRIVNHPPLFSLTSFCLLRAFSFPTKLSSRSPLCSACWATVLFCNFSVFKVQLSLLLNIFLVYTYTLGERLCMIYSIQFELQISFEIICDFGYESCVWLELGRMSLEGRVSVQFFMLFRYCSVFY